MKKKNSIILYRLNVFRLVFVYRDLGHSARPQLAQDPGKPFLLPDGCACAGPDKVLLILSATYLLF